MVSTRSRETAQTKLEDFTDDKNEIKTAPVKRKPSAADEGKTKKKVKVEESEGTGQDAEPSEAPESQTKDGDARNELNDKPKDQHSDDKVKSEDRAEDKSNDKPADTSKDELTDQAKDKPEHKNEEKHEDKSTEDSKDSKTDDTRSQKTNDTPVTTLKKSDDTDTHSAPIQINRAPVLTLFAACAAELEHPTLSWNECLSLGSAVSSICAISKGRAIGVIGDSDANHKDTHDARVSVLGFEVAVRNKVAYVGETRKGANEGYLKSKFGARYAEVKEAMQESLKSWKGHEAEFAKKGFRMYEQFRPGGGGWGQESGMYVEEVKRAIAR